MFHDGNGPSPETSDGPRANGGRHLSIRLTPKLYISQEAHVLNRVRQAVSALIAASGRRVSQCALLAEARPAIARIGGDSALLVVVVALAATLVAVVVLAAVFSAKPARRRAALAVLDRIFRWKG
jgi:hypothetical protein